MGAQWKVKGKEAAANARGKIFGKLAKEIAIAARAGADQPPGLRRQQTRRLPHSADRHARRS